MLEGLYLNYGKLGVLINAIVGVNIKTEILQAFISWVLS